ncbi:MAG: flippase-like domain-containing protein, partial [Acidobacteriaceae bacterium]|nr:flippase-like domain-containing protein [Acidobacteriaceae bacterium]
DSARVLMTSFAANNILPFRIGDIMRIFTYAPDLGTSPSVILSTVIFEKLLDVFVLVLFFVVSMGPSVGHHSRVMAATLLWISTAGLLGMILGARTLEPLLCRLFDHWSDRIPQDSKLGPYLKKLEHWILLALDCIRQIGIVGSLWLLAQTVVIWIAEGMIFVSGVHLIGLAVDGKGPWMALSAANLSYLIPSSPGGIGAFEWATKTSLVSHGALDGVAALFGLALHAWMLVSITAAGGAIFIVHRIRIHSSTPLLEEIEALPTEMP